MGAVIFFIFIFADNNTQGLFLHLNLDGLTQDCSNSIVNALELLQSCTKLSILIRICILLSIRTAVLWSDLFLFIFITLHIKIYVHVILFYEFDCESCRLWIFLLLFKHCWYCVIIDFQHKLHIICALRVYDWCDNSIHATISLLSLIRKVNAKMNYFTIKLSLR